MTGGEKRFADAINVFEDHGGTMRFREAIHSGITRYTLYKMLQERVVERLSRGLYRLTESPPLAQPDLVIAATRIPDGVLCLISVLSFHEITTQGPHELMIALSHDRHRRAPTIDYPPVRIFWFAEEAFQAGVETHKIDGVGVSVYGPEKTIADCLKFRNKIGLDVAIEGLRLHHETNGIDVDALMKFARICRVHNVIRPYLEAIV